MSPMRETFTLDWDSPEDIEAVKKFLKVHAKRLKCSEHEVIVKMAKELEKGVIVEIAKAEVQVLPKKKKEKEPEQ